MSVRIPPWRLGGGFPRRPPAIWIASRCVTRALKPTPMSSSTASVSSAACFSASSREHHRGMRNSFATGLTMSIWTPTAATVIWDSPRPGSEPCRPSIRRTPRTPPPSERTAISGRVSCRFLWLSRVRVQGDSGFSSAISRISMETVCPRLSGGISSPGSKEKKSKPGGEPD